MSFSSHSSQRESKFHSNYFNSITFKGHEGKTAEAIMQIEGAQNTFKNDLGRG
jgi:hypothetical protein